MEYGGVGFRGENNLKGNSSPGALTSQFYLIVELNDPRGLFQP